MPPRLARLLAVIVAVALVGGAFAVRGVLADDEGSSGRGSDGGDDGSGDGELVLLCDTDLGEAACGAAEGLPDVSEVRTVTGAEVLDSFGDDLDGDLWLTLDPMPGVLGQAVDGPGGFEVAGGTAMASAPLVLLEPLDTRLPCVGTADWTCLAEPGRPPVAVPTAASSAGTIVAAAATDALAAIGGGDLDTDGITATTSETALDQVRDLFDASPASSLAEQTSLLYQPGQAAGVVTNEGLATSSRDTSQGATRRLKVVPLEPQVTIGVVLVGLGATSEEEVATLAESDAGQTVRAALAEGGWTGEPGRTVGLPEPDLVYAVREELV